MCGDAATAADTVYAWQVDMHVWRPEDPRYAGTDTELTMKLTSFWFFCNRPTVAALMRLGTDMAAASRNPDANTAAALPQDADQQASESETAEPQTEEVQSVRRSPVSSQQQWLGPAARCTALRGYPDGRALPC